MVIPYNKFPLYFTLLLFTQSYLLYTPNQNKAMSCINAVATGIGKALVTKNGHEYADVHLTW